MQAEQKWWKDLDSSTCWVLVWRVLWKTRYVSQEVFSAFLSFLWEAGLNWDPRLFPPGMQSFAWVSNLTLSTQIVFWTHTVLTCIHLSRKCLLWWQDVGQDNCPRNPQPLSGDSSDSDHINRDVSPGGDLQDQLAPTWLISEENVQRKEETKVTQIV